MPWTGFEPRFSQSWAQCSLTIPLTDLVCHDSIIRFSFAITIIQQLKQWGGAIKTWINRTAGDHQKSFSYEKFELCVMLSFCFSHAATVTSPFRSSVFHFLAKLSKICQIFFSCEKKKMKLSLLHKNVNTSSHRKGNLMALTPVYQFELWLKVQDMPSKWSLPRQGPWNFVWVKQVFRVIRGRVNQVSLSITCQLT